MIGASLRPHLPSAFPLQPRRLLHRSKPHSPHNVPAELQSTSNNLVLSVLNAMPSKREAIHFIDRFFDPPTSKDSKKTIPQYRRRPSGPGATSAIHDHIGLVLLDSKLSDTHLATFATTLNHLHRLDLKPIVVVDDWWAGNHEAAARLRLKKSKLQEKLSDTFRVVDAIEAGGGRALAAYNGVANPSFSVESRLQPIETAFRLGHIPVIAAFSGSADGGADDANQAQVPPHQILISLANDLSNRPTLGAPVKLIVVNERGGLRNEHHGTLGFINIQEEFEDLQSEYIARLKKQTARPAFTKERSDNLRHLDLRQQLEELRIVRKVLAALPSSASAVITSAASSAVLISNLITDKPASSTSTSPHSFFIQGYAHPAASLVVRQNRHSHGKVTLEEIYHPTVLRSGLSISEHYDLSTVDIPKLTKLLEASFGRKLIEDEFWERMRNHLDSVIVAGDYDGASIVTREYDPLAADSLSQEPDQPRKDPIHYLDKFAVAPTSQGIGVADILWKRLKRNYKNLSWRSRAANPVNKWYFERSEGNLRLPGDYWILFWYGTEGVHRMAAYTRAALAITASFAPVKTQSSKSKG
ncbi:uncharacterized protein BJ171DRAFT_499924 [Polychytrium aggregatum]|uniref:uncharacterized protein n=1 Tax=Polychytrium aggregatum TaxID=110093 RepID=UPI0022FEC7C2|nr:uncharacterized protein BJ171DRAFT_499924 [Polychytrium aggregatum]KAI9205863.1 hypothetical protein BJ171DRAFT_499924 [Polychytrium aggregatum]